MNQLHESVRGRWPSVQAAHGNLNDVLVSVDAQDFDAVVRAILNRLDRSDLRVTVRRSPETSTAAATYEGRKAVILYGPLFIAKIGTTARTKWPVVFLFAHEVSHHVLGHAVPPNRGADYAVMELDADEWSGFVLAGLGASLEDTKQSIETLASLIQSASPDVASRLTAVERGWRKAHVPPNNGLQPAAGRAIMSPPRLKPSR